MTESNQHDDSSGNPHHKNGLTNGGDRRAFRHPALSADCEDGEPARSTPDAGQDRVNLRLRPMRSGPLLWLALLLGLVSVGLTPYPFWSLWQDPGTAEPTGRSASEFENLAERVDQIRQENIAEIESLRAEIDRISSELEVEAPGPGTSDLTDRIDQLSVLVERLQGERSTAVNGLLTRLDELESDVERRLEQFELRLLDVAGDLERDDYDLATRLLLMEVDSLFAIAQNHLLVSADGGVALKAWERAMERLTTLEGGEFQGLKEAARREFRQLQDYRPADFGLLIEQLFAMADAVAEWPVKTIQPGQPSAAPGSNEGWRARLGQVVDQLVRVESVDREFLGPDEIARARERVRSTLQTAALAIARTRPDLARRLIGEAADEARRAFDTEAASVSGALNTLASISESVEQVEPPALTDSRAELARLLGEMW